MKMGRFAGGGPRAAANGLELSAAGDHGLLSSSSSLLLLLLAEAEAEAEAEALASWRCATVGLVGLASAGECGGGVMLLLLIEAASPSL